MRILIITLVLTLALPVSAATWQRNDKAGSAGLLFLKLSGDARAVSMGYAVAGDATGASAFFINPAFIPFNGDKYITLEGCTLPAEIMMGMWGYSQKLGNFGTIGLSAHWLDAGVMEQVSIYPPNNPAGEFTAYDLSLGLNYGISMTDKFSMGVNLKYVREQLEEESVNGWVADIGTMFYTGYRTLGFGMIIRNFGPDLGFFDGDEVDSIATQMFPMPLEFRLGVSAELFEIIGMPQEATTLQTNIDFSHPNDDAESINLGLEFGWREVYFLRAGYQHSFSESDDVIRPLSFGAGAFLTLSRFALKVDYAYSLWGDLGGQQRLGLGFLF